MGNKNAVRRIRLTAESKGDSTLVDRAAPVALPQSRILQANAPDYTPSLVRWQGVQNRLAILMFHQSAVLMFRCEILIAPRHSNHGKPEAGPPANGPDWGLRFAVTFLIPK